MNGYYLLSPIEAAELLYRVMIRYERTKNSDQESEIAEIDFSTPKADLLYDFFERCTKDYSEDFGEQVLASGSKIKPGKSTKPRLLYDLKLAARGGLPYLLTNDDLLKLLKYAQAKLEPINLYRPVVLQRVTEKLTLFEGECWHLFYARQDEKLQRSLAIAILEFQPFGRVRMKAAKQEYSGSYRTYGGNEYYLLIELKTIQAKQKDLRVVVYCGAGKPEIMLGQFFDVEIDISSANVILEPVKGIYDDLTPKYLEGDNQVYKEVTPMIQKYYSEHYLDGVSSQSNIATLNDLERFLTENRKSSD